MDASTAYKHYRNYISFCTRLSVRYAIASASCETSQSPCPGASTPSLSTTHCNSSTTSAPAHLKEFLVELKFFIKERRHWVENSSHEGSGGFVEWCVSVEGGTKGSTKGHFQHTGMAIEEVSFCKVHVNHPIPARQWPQNRNMCLLCSLTEIYAYWLITERLLPTEQRGYRIH